MTPRTQETTEDSFIEELTFLNGKTVASRNFQVSMTLRCGNRCQFCPVELSGAEISAEAAAEALRGYAGRNPRQLGATELILTGGEPALSKALLTTARLGQRLGFRSVTMLSDAANFADLAFARAVRAAGVQRLFLSFHSHREELYDLLTGTRGRFGKAVLGITNSVGLPFAQVTCNMVMNKHNHADIPAHAAFLAGLRRPVRGPLALFLSTLEENPRWEELSVAHADAARSVRTACDEAMLPIAKFMGNWAMPTCIGGLSAGAPALVPDARWDTPTWYAPKGWTPAAAAAPSRFPRVKSQACRGCGLDGVCAGLSRVYASRYGVGELAAVKTRPPSASRRRRIHIA